MLLGRAINLDMIDADVIYYPNFFSTKDADTYFNSLLKNLHWQQDSIIIYGKTHLQPRLTAFYASNKNRYKYSNIVMTPNPFTGDLLKIKDTIESELKINFTSCLANLYRDGKDSNGWHADNEKELGENPVIASVSLGAERVFHFKHKFNKEQKRSLTLQHGSLLLMKGKTQAYWLHQIPKTKKDIEKRINLTFRIIA
ncbi:alpha-ketoglutarate-dependent dioxygenase AlkB [Sabulilitoribacter multivorans]|uniref:Alpha-ketoglutarate-dependent dioxygenase AlkB n=1 Tax=Flaviramulus multivorans TaxID=1304750 RepID=A0ABS9IIT4_9FLAO|nr:alpha-ketoglutarate-dependent dioxygenase AlkB [Flaviramulus multivorans]MCF7560375.1 alpha-ketoglutarate-dependent dioxygenase AlkB [Flaviramulus multivorans]